MKTLLISIGIVLLGANAFIHDRAARSSVKLSDAECALVKGSSFSITSFHMFTKCGILPQCKENDCPDDNCEGLETKPEPEAKNIGCADPDWWSQCVQWDNWNFNPKKPCAKQELMCVQVYDEELDRLVCKKEQPSGGFIIQPTAPDNCVTNTIPNPFEPVP
jgi:hypothetical protein